MYYVTYDKPKKISDQLIDGAILFASKFLDLDDYIEIVNDGSIEDLHNKIRAILTK